MVSPNFKNKGFTLLELLIVVLIIGTLYSTILPFGKRLYERFEALKRVEEVKTFLLEQKREAFLYGKRVEIRAHDESLLTQENQTLTLNEALFSLENPIVFYPLGTTNGGKLIFTYKQFTFELEITPITGEIQLVP